MTRLKTVSVDKKLRIYLDSELLTTISPSMLKKSSIIENGEVDRCEYIASLVAVMTKWGEGKLYDYLSRKDRSNSECRAYLEDKGLLLEAINKILLKASKYINDIALAERYIKYSTSKGMYRLKQELLLKGISASDIEIAINNLEDDGEMIDIAESANSLANKYMNNKIIDDKTLEKLTRYLLSRGYDYDIVNNIISEYRQRR